MKIGKLWHLNLIVLLLAFNVTRAQQFPQFSLFADNLNTYNPASTGVTDYILINGGARYQWLGMNGAPFSQNFNIQMPAYKLNSGIGLTIINSQQGLQRNTSAGFNYAYVIRKKKSTISFGLRAGLVQAFIDGSGIITPQGSYESGVINHNDPILPLSKISALSTDFSAGFLYLHKKFYLGLSSVYITEPQLKLTNTKSPKLNRNYITSLGKRFNVNKKISLSNNYLIKYSLTDLQAETNLMFNFKQTFSFGAGYRAASVQADAIMALISLKLSPKIILGYAYEYPLTVINKVSYGSQEILLTYRSGLSTLAKPGKIIYTPRF
jgi:type IX secretion system PorP/SprF family membrane protein